jgi:hypothetical protein
MMPASMSRQRRGLQLRLLLAPFVVMGGVHSLDLKINSVKCQSRPVTVKFDYVCNGDYLCTFGQDESVEGTCTWLVQCLSWFVLYCIVLYCTAVVIVLQKERVAILLYLQTSVLFVRSFTRSFGSELLWIGGSVRRNTRRLFDRQFQFRLFHARIETHL